MRKTIKRAVSAGSKRPRNVWGGMTPGLGWGGLSSLAGTSSYKRVTGERPGMVEKHKKGALAREKGKYGEVRKKNTASPLVKRAAVAARGGNRTIAKRLKSAY